MSNVAANIYFGGARGHRTNDESSFIASRRSGKRLPIRMADMSVAR